MKTNVRVAGIEVQEAQLPPGVDLAVVGSEAAVLHYSDGRMVVVEGEQFKDAARKALDELEQRWRRVLEGW